MRPLMRRCVLSSSKFADFHYPTHNKNATPRTRTTLSNPLEAGFNPPLFGTEVTLGVPFEVVFAAVLLALSSEFVCVFVAVLCDVIVPFEDTVEVYEEVSDAVGLLLVSMTNDVVFPVTPAPGPLQNPPMQVLKAHWLFPVHVA